MTIEVRATRPDELRAAAETLVHSLLGVATEAAWEQSLPSWQRMSSLSAWEDDRCVGHAGRLAVETVVPGGNRLPTAAVTRVGVLTTHRRRGIATRLMRQLVDDSVAAGQVLMSLRASETGIYGRYGFGMAGESANFEIDVRGAGPVRGADADGACHLVATDDLLDVVPPIYDTAIGARPGPITRPAETWWTRAFRAALERTAAASVAVHVAADGRPDGFVLYETEWNDDRPDEAPTGRGTVRELFAADIPSELALWQFLFDIDLVTSWRANGRPLDDAIRVAAADPRAVRVRAVDDEQWLRILDLDAALSARGFTRSVHSVRVAVTDELIPANRGTWEISADGVVPTDDPPQISTDIAGLGAAYLGGVSWTTLAGVGAVQVHDADALATADTLFAVPRQPWCGTFF